MRNYALPKPLPGEPSDAWLKRAAESIPAEDLMRQVVAWLLEREKRGRRSTPAWSVIGDITAHGSSVSHAIVDRFREKGE